jgi:hypothetical protein
MAEPHTNGTPDEIPAGIRAARAALRKDLADLLAKRRYRGKFAAYSNQGQVAIGNSYLALVRECIKRGIPDDAFIIERIEPGAGSEEVEEIESNWW